MSFLLFGNTREVAMILHVLHFLIIGPEWLRHGGVESRSSINNFRIQFPLSTGVSAVTHVELALLSSWCRWESPVQKSLNDTLEKSQSRWGFLYFADIPGGGCKRWISLCVDLTCFLPFSTNVSFFFNRSRFWLTLWLYFIFALLGFKPWASHLLGKYSTSELYHQPHGICN